MTGIVNDTQLLDINAESVALEAASCEFFIFRRRVSLYGEVVMGVKTLKPLGWACREYYKAEPLRIPGGLWAVEKGTDITVHLWAFVGDNTVQKAWNSDARLHRLIKVILTALVFWGFGTVGLTVAKTQKG
jgi:hypothetical protein